MFFTKIYSLSVPWQGWSFSLCWRDGGDRAGDAGMGGASMWETHLETKNAASPHSPHSLFSHWARSLYTGYRIGSSTSAHSPWTTVSPVPKQGRASGLERQDVKLGWGPAAQTGVMEPLPVGGLLSLPSFFFVDF